MDVEYAKLSRDMEFPREFSGVNELSATLASGLSLEGNDSPIPDLPIVGSGASRFQPDEEAEGGLC
jgi:hypothetical protein